MSSKGNCWDNALTESFFKTLNSAMIYHTIYHTLDQAKMEVWYHRKRTDSYLDYRTPEEFSKLKYLKSA
tara:strand:+ start:475 stop:681 length:207 start_codon:yes stop_codon:yes gene_type:complete